MPGPLLHTVLVIVGGVLGYFIGHQSGHAELGVVVGAFGVETVLLIVWLAISMSKK
jgi:hypothetical protein